MRLSSSFTFIAAIATPGTNGSHASRALTAANLSVHKGISNTRQLADYLSALLEGIDLTDTDAICSMVQFIALMGDGSSASCNDDKTEATYVFPPNPSEVCDTEAEFCQKDTTDIAIMSLPLGADITDTAVTFKYCTTYTKAPSDGFSLFLNKEACVMAEGKADASALLLGTGELDAEFNVTSCTSTVGNEVCSCIVCDDDAVDLNCPSLGVRTEGGCVSMSDGDEENPNVSRFTSYEPVEPLQSDGVSAAGVVVPSIVFSITLTVAALFV